MGVDEAQDLFRPLTRTKSSYIIDFRVHRSI